MRASAQEAFPRKEAQVRLTTRSVCCLCLPVPRSYRVGLADDFKGQDAAHWEYTGRNGSDLQSLHCCWALSWNHRGRRTATESVFLIPIAALRAPRYMLARARCLLFAWHEAGEGLSDDLRRPGVYAIELLKPVRMSAELVHGLDILSTQHLPAAWRQEETSN